MDKTSFTYWQPILEDEIWMGNMRYIHKGKDINQAALEAFGHLISDPLRLANADHADFKRLVNSFLTNKRFPTKTQPNGFKKLVDLKNI